MESISKKRAWKKPTLRILSIENTKGNGGTGGDLNGSES